MGISTTLMPPGGRGCGKRKGGTPYASCGLSSNGTPWHEFMLDPAVPYVGDLFRGIQLAEEVCPGLIPADWPDDMVLLVDVIGREFYKTMPTWMEETKHFGFSRNWGGFDFSKLDDRQPYLAPIHSRACITWGDGPNIKAVSEHLTMRHCRFNGEDVELGITVPDLEHYPDCIYHCWPMVTNFETMEGGRVQVSWGSYDPLNVAWYDSLQMDLEQITSGLYPQAEFSPGVFAILPITHIEYVDYIPQESNADQAGLPIVVMEE